MTQAPLPLIHPGSMMELYMEPPLRYVEKLRRRLVREYDAAPAGTRRNLRRAIAKADKSLALLKEIQIELS